MTLQEGEPINRHRAEEEVAVKTFIAAVERGREDRWPLSLLAPQEVEHLKGLVKCYHQGEICLERAPRLFAVREQLKQWLSDPSLRDELKTAYQEMVQPLERLASVDQIEAALEEVRQAILYLNRVVLDRGKQATVVMQDTAKVLDEINKRSGEITEREQAVASRESAAAEKEAETKRQLAQVLEKKAHVEQAEEELNIRKAGLDERDARTAAEEDRLAAWGEELRGLAFTKKQADDWWTALEKRIASASGVSIRPSPAQGREYKPKAGELELLRSEASRLLRDLLVLPEGVGAGTLEGRFTRRLKATSFSCWPVPHIAIARQSAFSGKAEVVTTAHVEAAFSGRTFTWPKGVSLGSSSLQVTANEGECPLPLPVLQALSREDLCAPGMVVARVDTAGLSFRVKGWQKDLRIPRDVAAELIGLVTGASDPIDALVNVGVIDDPLIIKAIRAKTPAASLPTVAQEEGTPLKTCLRSLLTSRQEWNDTPAELFRAILIEAKQLGLSASLLPANSSILSRSLGQLAPGLGISLLRQRTAHQRVLVLRRTSEA